jgi:hypothetical protein
METKKEKAKWTKACKKLKSGKTDSIAPDKTSSKDSSSSDDEKSKARARTFTPREHRHNNGTDSSSPDSRFLSDKSGPEQDTGCRDN